MNVLIMNRTVARMVLYRFLCEAYTYPRYSFIEMLLDNRLWEELKAAYEVFGIQESPVNKNIKLFIKQYAGNSEQLLQALQVEYTYLFINAVPNVQAPPYESIYSGEALLMGEPVSQVLQCYREAGLVMSNSFDALPDHISAETEFMFYLIQQQMKASQSIEDAANIWRKRQNEFLRQHLHKWVPLFLEKVNSNARIPFYRYMAEITESILNAEKNQIQEV